MNPTRAVLRSVLQPVFRTLAAGFVPTAGPELVTNGSFASDTAWTKGAQWTIAAGVSTKTGAGTSTLQQSVGIVVGRAYTVTFTITATVTVGAGMSVFLGQTSGTIRTAPGTYTEQITPGLGTDLYFIARGGTGDWEGSIDNVSVKALSY